ncbi:MAG: Hsp33 family molecular chaperone HslO [Actinobacteria bacterium]|nr:Hsp33 family molecular chaperone HslO [Actinomycetota bacterium]
MDFLIRTTDRGQNFRVMAAVTTGVTETARVRHDTWPVATAALGRTLTGALLLGANLKGNDMITLRMIGDGPLGAIVVSANARGEVRGYVQEPHVDLPRRVEGKLPVGEAVGRGMLNVTRDLGMKEPFTGSVEIISGEIAEDLTHYLVTSEQTPSAVALGVLVDREGKVRASGGFWLEILPEADEEVVAGLEKNLACLPTVSSMIGDGAGPEEIARAVAGGYELKILDSAPVTFKCSCARRKVEGILVSLGKDDILRLIEERGGAEVRCHFCGEVYNFSVDDLKNLLEEMQR